MGWMACLYVSDRAFFLVVLLGGAFLFLSAFMCYRRDITGCFCRFPEWNFLMTIYICSSRRREWIRRCVLDLVWRQRVWDDEVVFGGQNSDIFFRSVSSQLSYIFADRQEWEVWKAESRLVSRVKMMVMRWAGSVSSSLGFL